MSNRRRSLKSKRLSKSLVVVGVYCSGWFMLLWWVCVVVVGVCCCGGCVLWWWVCVVVLVCVGCCDGKSDAYLQHICEC